MKLDPASTLIRYASVISMEALSYATPNVNCRCATRPRTRARHPARRSVFNEGGPQRPCRTGKALLRTITSLIQGFDGRALCSAAKPTADHELRAAVKINDAIADGHFQLGRALLRAGSEAEGKQELKRAQVLNEKRRAGEAERFLRKLP